MIYFIKSTRTVGKKLTIYHSTQSVFRKIQSGFFIHFLEMQSKLHFSLLNFVTLFLVTSCAIVVALLGILEP